MFDAVTISLGLGGTTVLECLGEMWMSHDGGAVGHGRELLLRIARR